MFQQRIEYIEALRVMMRSRLIAVGGFFLAALLSSPTWGSIPPQPGTVNYIEGQAAIGAQAITEKSVGSAKLAAGQSLSTENGRVEILLNYQAAQASGIGFATAFRMMVHEL